MNKWYRVTKKRPCSVCSKPDWCTYADDAACCMRVESEKQMRNGGWLHRTSDVPRYIPRPRQAIPDRPLDALGLWQKWMDATDQKQLNAFGIILGVDTDALRAIGCSWASEHKAWAFPMKDADGTVIGIRLRNDEGHKWAVKGSHQGLFLPSEYPFEFDGTLYIVEGPTDLAAAMSLGLYAIGRPACLGQEQMIVKHIERQRAKRVVIVTDNDEPGLRGATKLQAILPVLSSIWVPPVKDIREFLIRGGTQGMIAASINDLVWERPKQREAA